MVFRTNGLSKLNAGETRWKYANGLTSVPRHRANAGSTPTESIHRFCANGMETPKIRQQADAEDTPPELIRIRFVVISRRMICSRTWRKICICSTRATLNLPTRSTPKQISMSSATSGEKQGRHHLDTNTCKNVLHPRPQREKAIQGPLGPCKWYQKLVRKKEHAPRAFHER